MQPKRFARALVFSTLIVACASQTTSGTSDKEISRNVASTQQVCDVKALPYNPVGPGSSQQWYFVVRGNSVPDNIDPGNVVTSTPRSGDTPEEAATALDGALASHLCL